jgi:hypothetical protein
VSAAVQDPVQTDPAPKPPPPSRGRLYLAGGTTLLLVALVAAVLALTGGETAEHEFTVAPPRCIEGWNGNGPALVAGQHQFSVHNYQEVEVLTLTPDGSAAVAQGGACAVVFASASLDLEPEAAAMIQRPPAWLPLSDFVPPERLAELQSAARSSYTGRLAPDGSITPL